MTPHGRLFLVLASATLFSCVQSSGGASGTPARGDALSRVALQTELGEIVIEVDSRNAPGTAENFFYYVDGGLYDQGHFHRTVTPDNQTTDEVRIEIIQAEINQDRLDQRLPAIPLERTSDTGLRHVNGTVSMARGGPDSATSSFFICIGDQPSLDYGGQRNADGQGFAAFGQVVSGMDIVLRIQNSAREEQRLTPRIAIISAKRVQ